jgi:hypothetical protein
VPALKPYFEAALKQAEVLSGKVDARVAYDVSLIEGEPKVGLKAESIKLSDLSVRLKGEKRWRALACSSCGMRRWMPPAAR